MIYNKTKSIKTLRTFTLSCIFSEFVGMFFHNVWPLVKILYLDLLNLNGGILYMVGYLHYESVTELVLKYFWCCLGFDFMHKDKVI